MPKTNKVIVSLNAGELSPLMSSRFDQEKYGFGCRTLENFIPLIYGGAERRPGTEYIATQKTQSAKGRVVSFEHSVDDTYILLFENQVIRVFRNGEQVLAGTGTEDLSGVDGGALVAHWKLNESEGVTVVNADDPGTYDGEASTDAATLTADGKAGIGCFDLDGQYTVEIADAAAFSFTIGDSNDSPFSIVCWGFVTQQNDIQILLSKWRDQHTAREWRLSLTNERKLQLHLADTQTDLTSGVVCQWKLNDDAADTNVIASLPTYAIDDADAGNNKFIISDDGDLSASFPNSSEFTVAGSAANDGQYTVTSTSYSAPNFTINVASVTDGTDDGTVAPHAGVSNDSNTEDINATGKISGALDFGGDQTMIIDDSADFSFGNSTTDEPMSIAAWVYVTANGSEQVILAKWDFNDAIREWKFYLDSSEKLGFEVYDENAEAAERVTTDSALTGGWHFVVATYGGDETDPQNDIVLYVDGVAVDQTPSATGTYIAMENLTVRVTIGAKYSEGSLVNYWQDKIDNVVLFDVELTQANVSALWNDGSGTESMPSREVSAVSDAAISLGWHLFTCTYSAPADETAAADGIILYVDGAAVDSTATNDADYKAMQGAGEAIRIGSQNSVDDADEKFWGDKIDEVAIFSDVLTPTEVASLYTSTAVATAYEITTPYLTADLFALDFKRSADVMFITHKDYEPRKLSRTGHTSWTLAEADIPDGPFRKENDNTSFAITPSATTGNITLTATGTGNNPFVMGATTGHEPSGTASTSKSLTGALFRLVQSPSISGGTDSTYVSGLLAVGVADVPTSTLTIYKGVTWDLVTNGTWGSAADSATLVLERSYDAGTTYETVVSFTSAANYNIETKGTEENDDALYRLRVAEAGGASNCAFNLSIRDTGHIGIVEITSVASSTSALATVLTTLGSTDLTHRWSEGAWSNYRGWPMAVDISPEERLTFGGSVSKPLTVWGSVVGDFTSFKEGILDDDAIVFTLIGSGQQNTIRWMLPKTTMMIGTIGGEHLLGASAEDEALTPTNVQAKLQATYGSEKVSAIIVNNAILFLQRGARKIRELIYSFEDDVYRADDLTIFAHHITESGIVDMAFQRTPDPMLWCVRDDGEIAILSYEREQNVFAWSRLITADSTSNSVFESVAVIYGGAGKEDEVWATVKRMIGEDTKRYVERLKPRDWGSTTANAFFVDSGITYDSTATSTVTAAHLKGETLAVFADGVAFDDAVANASTGVITLKLDGTTTTAEVVQYGLPYDSTLKPMRLDLGGLGLATTKKIPKVIIDLYKTMYGKIGTTTSNVTPIVYRDASDDVNEEFPLFTGYRPHAPRGGYNRDGDIIIIQDKPAPMTIRSLTFDIGVAND